MTNSRLLVGAAAAIILAVAACEQSSSPDAAGGASTSSTGGRGASADSPAWLLTAAPADAVDVAAAKKSAAEGDRVALRGKIGGRSDPMSADSAVFIMMDPSIPSCADNEGDTCATPWDYCCEPQEVITANNATVQLVDAAGAPLAIDLRSHGIEPLDEVIVVGTVGPRPNEQTLIVKATSLYRAGG